MTREIKIRVWDKEKKEMSMGMSLVMLAGWISAIYPRLGNEEYLEWTGLKDKNGKEIYEGDIVKSGRIWNSSMGEDDKPYFSEQIDIVKFSDGVFATFDKKERYSQCLSQLMGIREGGFPSTIEIEIIGNLYENPELIK